MQTGRPKPRLKGDCNIIYRRWWLAQPVQPFLDDRIALEFAMSVPVPDLRKSERQSISVEVELKRSGAINYVVQAFDVSEHGCRVEFVERPWIGESVRVKFEGLEPLRSTVRWTGEFTAGLEFENPIDSRVLQWLLERLK